jgi:hypothetical protein
LIGEPARQGEAVHQWKHADKRKRRRVGPLPPTLSVSSAMPSQYNQGNFMRVRSNISLFATLVFCAFIVGTTDFVFPSGNITNSVLVFLRFLPEFIGGITLYLLYGRGLPRAQKILTDVSEFLA